MIRTSEFSRLTPKAKPVPYFRARLAELVDQGMAIIRTRGRPDAEVVRGKRVLTRLSWLFASRLAEMQDALVYYSAARSGLSFRRPNPRPGLNGKVYVPKLPADARLIGRYTYPHSRRAFIKDLAQAMEVSK